MREGGYIRIAITFLESRKLDSVAVVISLSPSIVL